MNIDYSGLWRLLVDRGLKKTELIELCSISSRTLSKLSKNQNVNTNTLLEICRALDCELSDIASIRRDGEFTSLYDAFKEAKTDRNGENIQSCFFEYKGQRIVVKKTLEKANKRTVIHCEGNSVSWEQIYPLGHTPVSEKHILVNASSFAGEKGSIRMVVISGTPSCIQGLDEGIFLSHLRYGEFRNDVGDKIFVMSEPRFKVFAI